MKQIILCLLSFMIIGSGLEACVKYTPSTGTYIIDKSGCVGKTKKGDRNERSSRSK